MSGLYENIHKKRQKVAEGVIDPATGKKMKMRKKGQEGAPTASAFKPSCKNS